MATKRIEKTKTAKPERDKVAIDLTFYPPDRRHRDDDNMLAAMKAGRDGLADALGVNDHKFKTSIEVAEEIGNFVRVEVCAIEPQEGNPP